MDLHEFERLNPEEQEKLFHRSPFKEKGELLLHAHNPLALAHSLSQEELYLTAKEMDQEERTELMRYAAGHQLIFISDIDCWTKDRIDPEGFALWLETLLAAGEECLLKWMNEISPEILTAGFQKVVQILKPEREYPVDELLGDRPYFTLDENYFILVNEENLETIKRAIEILYENYRGRYVALLEEVISEVDDEIEEEAFQRRAIRLAERGFPDFETAYKIYRPITQEEFEGLRRQSRVAADPGEIQHRVPNYPTLWSPERLLLDEALLMLRSENSGLGESLQEEWAWLSNKVIACEGIDFSSEERIRSGVERARYFVNLGLEFLTGGDLQKASKILQGYWLEGIFRWGVTPLLSLREEALKMIRENWPDSRKSFLEFLDSPYEAILEGLTRPIPQCYDPEIKELLGLRDFKSLRDIERAKLSLKQIRGTFEFLNRQFPVLMRRLLAEKRRGDPRVSETSLFGILGTIFSNFFLKRELDAHPLNPTELAQFVHSVFETNGSRRCLKPSFKEDFLNRHFSQGEGSLLRPLWGFVFAALEEELGNLQVGNETNFRYLAAVMVRPLSASKSLRSSR